MSHGRPLSISFPKPDPSTNRLPLISVFGPPPKWPSGDVIPRISRQHQNRPPVGIQSNFPSSLKRNSSSIVPVQISSSSSFSDTHLQYNADPHALQNARKHPSELSYSSKVSFLVKCMFDRGITSRWTTSAPAHFRHCVHWHVVRLGGNADPLGKLIA